MNYSKLKKDAIKKLEKNQKVLIITVLILFAVMLFCSEVGFLVNSDGITWLLMWIAEALLSVGFFGMLLKTANGKSVKINDLTASANSFLKYFGISAIVGGIICLLSLLALLSFQSLVSIMVCFEQINHILAGILIILGTCLTTGTILVIIYLLILFSQSIFILYEEKDLPVLHILSKSFVMMDGYALDYFVLVLSFIGWFFLGLCTFCIAFLWIIPYFGVTLANFYKIVKKEFKASKGDEAVEAIFNNKVVEESVEEENSSMSSSVSK